MQRRKFVIGTGSLFAGAAAGIGTGAFTQMASGERTVKVRAADDSTGFLAIGPAGKLPVEYKNGSGPSPTPTNTIVTENSDGAVEIEISGRRTDKIGVNEGSTYWWDEALEVALWKGSDGLPGYYQGQWLVSIAESIPGVTFYTGTQGNRSYGVSDVVLDNVPNHSQPQYALVGVRVKEDELPDQQRTYKGTPTQGTVEVTAERK